MERAVVVVDVVHAALHAAKFAIGRKFAIRVLAPFVPAVRLSYRHAKSTVATFRDAGAIVLTGTDSNHDLTAPYQVGHGESLHADSTSRYPEHPRRVDRWPPGEVAPSRGPGTPGELRN